jgi:hypothetical protein
LSELVGDQATQRTGLGRGDPLQIDLDLVGVIDPVGIVADHTGIIDILLAEGFLQALNGLVGFRLQRVLHLYLQHQMAAAPKVEPQADVVPHIVQELLFGSRDTEDAKNAQQNRGDNHHGFRREILLHGNVNPL